MQKTARGNHTSNHHWPVDRWIRRSVEMKVILNVQKYVIVVGQYSARRGMAHGTVQTKPSRLTGGLLKDRKQLTRRQKEDRVSRDQIR